jgi:hypothetical protein
MLYVVAKILLCSRLGSMAFVVGLGRLHVLLEKVGH